MKALSLVAALGVALAIAAQPSAGVSSSPSEMTWTDSGSRSGGPFTFTAAPPLCRSGTGNDVGGTTGIKMVHTCSDGSGTFEFEVMGVGSFHFNAAGTGRYATLRGTGSCSLIDNGDGTYTRSCHALADFDDTAPSARIAKIDGLGARRVSRVGVTFTTSDNVAGNAVTYRLSLSAAGRALDHVAGSTTGGSVVASLNVRLPKRARRLALSLKVSDPLHNSRTVIRSARVRR